MNLHEQVALIASQATPANAYRWKLGLAPSVQPTEFAGSAGAETFVAAQGEVELISEPAVLLERLYASASTADRGVFGQSLLSRLTSLNSRVIARTLAATGSLSVLENGTGFGQAELELWRGLIHTMRFEPNLFSESDFLLIHGARGKTHSRALEAVKKDNEVRERSLQMMSSGYPTGPLTGSTPVHHPFLDIENEAAAVIARIRYLRLAAAINDQPNPAVDADRRVLVSRLHALHFTTDLSKTLDEIEKRSAAAATGFDFKAAMDLLRTFYETFFKEACGKVEVKVGKSAPIPGPGVSHFGSYREYLRHHDFLGPEEDALLNQLYKFLSNQGAHKLSGEPEQFRVAYATVIEWCMLIAGRVTAYLA